MKLYHHIRSSASYRVRIALALKNLPYESSIVDLLKGGQVAPGYTELNPAALVPLLEDEGRLAAQSLAIIEYLDERYPEPPLLPRSGAADRARVRQLALSIACDIHPLNNLRVLRRLKDAAGFSEEDCQSWSRHWIALGFGALEATLSGDQRGAFCFGDAPGLADIFLVPQMVNAARVGLDLSPYPRLQAIERACMALTAFSHTHPAQWQPA